ncbi:hypothetical protein NQ315_013322 [Exocentrus adspersus]|uniref:Uncharacterized protein n=1 Tax=Exocentrus adspersus TaxID=1586481 RepID=A0AAV8V6L6_9CUCU|nr:hypothetical protein NQ315_013322 [Exocentrus adspersus]
MLSSIIPQEKPPMAPMASMGSMAGLKRFRQSRFNARRLRKRVVFKHGDCNVVQGNVAKRRRKYLQDIFTTLVDAQWRWTLLVFAMNFLLSWLLFAVLWWLIVFTHGDLIEEHLNGTTNNGTEPWTPCVTSIHGFSSCFLFSVETQHTIGYGVRATTEECPEAIFIMCVQSICGVMIQAFMVGVVFAKLSRPKKEDPDPPLLQARCDKPSGWCPMPYVQGWRHEKEPHHRGSQGVIESTGMTTQARSSYLPSEILWGHRFQSLITFKKDSGEYEVDYALFNNTVEVDTPLCSARELDERKAIYGNDCLDTYSH